VLASTLNKSKNVFTEAVLPFSPSVNNLFPDQLLQHIVCLVNLAFTTVSICLPGVIFVASWSKIGPNHLRFAGFFLELVQLVHFQFCISTQSGHFPWFAVRARTCSTTLPFAHSSNRDIFSTQTIPHSQLQNARNFIRLGLLSSYGLSFYVCVEREFALKANLECILAPLHQSKYWCGICVLRDSILMAHGVAPSLAGWLLTGCLLSCPLCLVTRSAKCGCLVRSLNKQTRQRGCCVQVQLFFPRLLKIQSCHLS
jgi:hypothetical protein